MRGEQERGDGDELPEGLCCVGGSAALGAAAAGTEPPGVSVCSSCDVLEGSGSSQGPLYFEGKVSASQPWESCGRGDHPKLRMERGERTGVEGPRFL